MVALNPKRQYFGWSRAGVHIQGGSGLGAEGKQEERQKKQKDEERVKVKLKGTI